VRSDARPDQLITFARFRDETLPIKYRDLLSAAHDQTGTFQLPGSIRDGWPLDTQHCRRVLIFLVSRARARA
jgi:hypothetical protein